MQKITPFLWFDGDAENAAKFYTSLFKKSKITQIVRYTEAGKETHGRKPGSIMTVAFKLNGQDFTALNGGPIFKFTPAISFFVNCKTEKEVNLLFHKLSNKGNVLMPLNKYPFSKKYAWISDKYGVSWQLFFGKAAKQKITPCLMFVKKQHRKAEEAMNFYSSVFKNSKIEMIARYEKGEDVPGTIKHARFSLAGEKFIAMDSSLDHKFTFNEAVSFVVNCKTQKEIDYYWSKLSKGGDKKSQVCGWLKDKYGVSWQVVPNELPKLLKNKKKSEKVLSALMQMKKLDIKKLKKAYNQ